MPRPCAVEYHARGYKRGCGTFWDAMALCRGVSRWWLPREKPQKTFGDATSWCRGVSRSWLQKETPQKFLGCHGLAPWSLTLVATKRTRRNFWDATALRRGVSRS